MRRQPGMPASVLVTVALLVGSAVLGTGVATAATKTGASGTIAVVSNVPDRVRQVGRNVKTDATAVVTLAGTLTGTATEVYTAITHPNGRTHLHGKGFFDGTVAGRAGSLRYVFRGDATSGVIVITGGSGGLKGVHGRLPYELDPATGLFDYSGQVRFTRASSR